jgi:predicted site-specific integrase-resolvase
MQIPDDLVPVKVGKRLLRCSASTLYRLVKSGRLKGWRRAASRILVSKRECEALLVLIEPAGAPSARVS